MNCKKNKLSLTKEKYLFYYKVVDLYSSDFTLYFSFWICTLSRSDILVPLHLYGRKYLLSKLQSNAFYQPFTAYKKSLSATNRTTKFGLSRKLQTLTFL